MMRRRLSHIIVSFLLVLLSTGTAFAASRMSDYKPWFNKPINWLMQKGVAFETKDIQDSALICYYIVAGKYDEDLPDNERQQCAEAMEKAAVINTFYFSNFSDAYNQLSKARSICKQFNYNRLLPLVLMNIANLYTIHKSIDPSESTSDETARKLYTEAFNMSVEQKNWALAQSNYINLNSLSIPLESRFVNVQQHFQNIIETQISHNTEGYEYVRQLSRGITLMLRHDYQGSISAFREMLRHIDDPENKVRDSSLPLTYIAEVYAMTGKYIEGIASLQELLRMSKGGGEIDLRAETWQRMEHLYHLSGDADGEQRAHIEYLEAKDSLYQQIGNLIPTALQGELNEVDQQMQDMKFQRTFQRAVIIFVVILLLGASLSLYFIAKKNRSLNARNRSLYEQIQKTLIQSNANAKADKKQRSSISHEKVNDLLEKLKSKLDEETICNSSTTLKGLADELGTNTTYLSQAINTGYGMNFSQLINHNRIIVACRRMSDKEKYGNLTIDAIAQSVGFKSRSSFVAAFKKETGLKPSEYLKISKEQTHPSI